MPHVSINATEMQHSLDLRLLIKILRIKTTQTIVFDTKQVKIDTSDILLHVML